MAHDQYRDMMVMLVTNLEPIHYKKGNILLNQLEESGAVLFISKGKIGFGYEINRVQKFPFI